MYYYKCHSKKEKKDQYSESLPLENCSSVVATDVESDTSLMMTVTCLTLSIKSLPLIKVNVYGTLRGVREEWDWKEGKLQEEGGGEEWEEEG